MSTLVIAGDIMLCVVVIGVLLVSFLNTRTIIGHTQAIRALQASLTGVQSVGRVLCPHCFGVLSWVPWGLPAESSWWCTRCHQWINLKATHSGETFKINSGRTTRSPNDHAQSNDTQTTQTHETGVAQG